MGILQTLFRKKPKAQLRKMAGDFELPAFPKVAMEVRALLRNDASTNEQIGACIKRDAGLTLRILQSVNSAANARRRSIGDPTQAVGMLGRANLEYLVLAHATCDAVPDPKHAGFSAEQFWHIARSRASLAETIAKATTPSEAGVAYTASMLQDMAVPVLAATMRKDYRQVLDQAQSDWERLDEHERERFGWDHGEFGGWMSEAWSFPDPITAAIASHHRDVHESLDVPASVRAVAFVQSAYPTGEEAERLLLALDEAFGISPDEARRLLQLHFEAA